MRSSLFLLAFVVSACAVGPSVEGGPPIPGTTASTSPATSVPQPPANPTTTAPPASTSTTTTTTTTLPSTAALTLTEVETVWGEISPKSVVATGDGLVFAQNMMYRHTITVYDSERQLLATIPDTVDLAAFGVEGYTGQHRGAPVEAAPTSDGAFVYVSNYQMYGQGFDRPGGDGCNNSGYDTSFVYRVAVDALAIDQVIPVGAVPKYLAVTPDDGTVLVSNWCSFDVSVIDTATATETTRIPVGRHPRGIAVTRDGGTAFIAVMGSRDIVVLDLATLTVSWFENVGANPRHIVLSPDDRTLYVTLNGAGRVAVVDAVTGDVRATVSTGQAPRSMAISDDGASLYVVNYLSNTVSKIDTATLEVVQVFTVASKPIGITFDAGTRTVWVASYSGAITVFAEIDPFAKPEVKVPDDVA